MKWFVVVLLILGMLGGHAYADDEYDTPMFPGDTGILRTPRGNWEYDTPMFPGDTGTWRGPGGRRYEVDSPMFPGDTVRIRRGW